MTDLGNLKKNIEFKNKTHRSSRFISLSGMSGVMIGMYAIGGAIVANILISNHQNGNSGISLLPISFMEYILAGVALLVLILSIFTAFVFSNRNAKRSNEKLWDVSSKRLLINFCIPLFTGGVFCIVLYQYGFIGLIVPSMLIFYGLACLNASKYTLGKIRYLGMANIIIGLISTQFIGFALYFWAIGFGCMHILYGILMQYKYNN